MRAPSTVSVVVLFLAGCFGSHGVGSAEDAENMARSSSSDGGLATSTATSIRETACGDALCQADELCLQPCHGEPPRCVPEPEKVPGVCTVEACGCYGADPCAEHYGGAPPSVCARLDDRQVSCACAGQPSTPTVACDTGDAEVGYPLYPPVLGEATITEVRADSLVIVDGEDITSTLRWAGRDLTTVFSAGERTSVRAEGPWLMVEGERATAMFYRDEGFTGSDPGSIPTTGVVAELESGCTEPTTRLGSCDTGPPDGYTTFALALYLGDEEIAHLQTGETATAGGVEVHLAGSEAFPGLNDFSDEGDLACVFEAYFSIGFTVLIERP